MSTVNSKLQLSSSKLQCSPHTIYYGNFFVLRMAVTINGQLTEIGFSENGDITLNCHYPGTECMSITFDAILSQVEAVLKKHGVGHISNFWLGEVPFIQVGFSSEYSLKTFLCSQQEIQGEIAPLLSVKLRDGQSTASAGLINYEYTVEVETELFLVLPDAEDSIRAVSIENYNSCLALWKESEKFDFVALFRAYQLKAGKGTLKGNLSVNVLVSELSDVVDWFHFGLYLGVPPSDLLRIERDRQFTMEHLSHMLDWWIKNEEHPTWSAVVRALVGIKMRGLAEKMAVKYNVVLPTDVDQKDLEVLPLQTEVVHSSIIVSLQTLRRDNGRKSKQLEQVLEKLKQERGEKIKAKISFDSRRRALTLTQQNMNSLSMKKKEAEKVLQLKEKELFFLQQIMDKSNRDLMNIIDSKEAEIAQLKKQLSEVNSEFRQAREEAQQQREKLHQTTIELEKQSVSVRELERTRANLDRERSRVDMMLMQLCGMNQSERIVPAKLDMLKKAVAEKEEEVGKLSHQLEAKETEKQKLLEQVEKQSQHEEDLEDQLVLLTAEVSELRASLEEAKDGRVKAEVELEDLRRAVSPIPKTEPAPSVAGNESEKITTGPIGNEEGTITYVALYSYNPRKPSKDLSFSKGEKLHIIDKYGDWWLGRSLKTGREGYVPSNFVSQSQSISIAQEWFFGNITCADAEKILLQTSNPIGTFLVRENESHPGDYTLSVRNGVTASHYRISKTNDGKYFITRRCIFNSLDELIQYYSYESDGLCCQLTVICPKIEPPTSGLSYTSDSMWEVERSSIKLRQKLGAGQFNEVWLGIWNGTTPVNVKVLKPGSRPVHDLQLETEIMKTLQHKNMIQLYALCSKEEPIYIITELMKHGNLVQYLKVKERSLKLPQLIDMSAQVAAGMAYLERQNCIHRDLTARNIHVGENNRNMIYKVADFGMARVLINEKIYRAHADIKIPIRWTAPEAAKYKIFSIKSDVWSYGIVLYEVITYGGFPYLTMTNKQVMEALQSGYHMPIPKGCPDKFYRVMLECWQEDPANRPTFETLQKQMEEFSSV